MFRLKLATLLAVAVGAAALAAPGGLRAQEGDGPALDIAVVDMNQALNNSVAGKRSKKILLAQKSQLESELKAKEKELKQLNEELQSNIMLSEEGRSERQQDLRQRQQELRKAVQQAQQELQQRERQYTQTIFNELKTVIGMMSRENGYDLVLEKGAAEVVLYSGFEMEDITRQVIDRYNQWQNAEQEGQQQGGQEQDAPQQGGQEEATQE